MDGPDESDEVTSEKSACKNNEPINGEQKRMLDEMNELFDAQLSQTKNVNKESILKKRELFHTELKIQCQIDDWLNKRKIKEQEKALVQSSEKAQLYHQLLDKEGYESGKIIIIDANEGKLSE